MIAIVVLPEGYPHDHFTLTVIEKSDRAQIRQVAKDLDKQNDGLDKAVKEFTPKDSPT